MTWWKKMAKKVTDPKENKRLSKWQSRYEDAKLKYTDDLNLMNIYDGYYEGTRKVMRSDDSGYANKEASNIRNIEYELIESEVDNSIPMPKVTAVHEEDKDKAKIIEEYLKNEILQTNMRELNDLQERTTPIQGGSFYLVEWDNTKGYHCTVGDILVTVVHPRQVIPQPGVIDIEQMDYIFVRTPQTKAYVKRRFNKDVEGEAETDKEIRGEVESEDIVTVITCYYKNDDNSIGLYRWCGDVELEDIPDYQARMRYVCKKCGATKVADVCECGSKSFEQKKDETESVSLFNEGITSYNAFGEPIMGTIEVKVEVPYYKPKVFPLVLRKNISRDKKLLGSSDVAVIADQQESIKKYGTQINEKLLTGGSVVTLPAGLGIETNDEQMKIIRVDTPAQKNLIDVINLQADTTQDRIALEQAYSWAKSALGITDAYQGKHDASAISGSAKQYSINQAAGRLESKRIMKNQAYAKIYEYMFKLALAYADDPVPINMLGKDGEVSYAHFDKKAFLKQDKSGDWYWNDEFLFDIDPTSTLLTNREAMWTQADQKLQSGAFGPIGDLETNYLYWLEQERNGYPNAGEIKNEIIKRIEEQKSMQNMNMMQMMTMTGGGNNEVPNM